MTGQLSLAIGDAKVISDSSHGLVVGVDENGLGPLLGPMIVTAASFETAAYDREKFWAIADEGLSADDSKNVFTKGRLAFAERETLSWLAAFGLFPKTHAQLVKEIGRISPFGLPCDKGIDSYCLPSSVKLPFWAKDFDAEKAKTNAKKLSDYGIKPTTLSAFVICPGAFNLATEAQDANKLRLDALLMIDLVKECVWGSNKKALALCGKVGSTARYTKWLKATKTGTWTPQTEGRAESTYNNEKMGTVSFIRDADGFHLPVSVASMVGKYLRELAMADLNNLLAPEQRPVSGYRDKLTAKFVEDSANVRKKMGIKDKCFRRKS